LALKCGAVFSPTPPPQRARARENSLYRSRSADARRLRLPNQRSGECFGARQRTQLGPRPH